MQIWTSWYLFGRLPCPKVERNGSPSTQLITVQKFLYLDKCKYIKCWAVSDVCEAGLA
jgi:hypothetical protein